MIFAKLDRFKSSNQLYRGNATFDPLPKAGDYESIFIQSDEDRRSNTTKSQAGQAVSCSVLYCLGNEKEGMIRKPLLCGMLRATQRTLLSCQGNISEFEQVIIR